MLEHITEFWGERDVRMTKYPLMDRPGPTYLISCFYLLVIKLLGPALMKNRKPFELRSAMIAYNAILVGVSGWLCFNYSYNGWFTRYSWRCENTDPTNSPENIKLVLASYVFYLSKLMEFADSVFFVLRKKDSQLNFLHVFHHCIVPVTTWYGVSYGPTGNITIFPLLNTFVHVWMYLYYGLAAIGPSVQKYLWWKKYLTSLQMIQFSIVLVFFLQLCFFPPEGCSVTGFQVALCVGQAVIFLGLFLHFYLKSYAKKPVNKYHLASAEKKHQNGKEA